MKQHEYDPENDKWFRMLVTLCICIGYIAATLLNTQLTGLLEDLSRTTIGNIVLQCDSTTEPPVFFDQMVLGTNYRTRSAEIFERWIESTAVSENFNYPEDLTEISHYTSVYRPNYPSIVELYSHSADTTWFRVYPDNFNSMNTRACGTYQAVR